MTNWFKTNAVLRSDIEALNARIASKDALVLKLIRERDTAITTGRELAADRNLERERANRLAEDNAHLRARLAPFIARNRDPVTKRFVSTTSAGETADV